MTSFSAKLYPENFKKIVSILKKYQITAIDENILLAYLFRGCRINIYKTYKILIQGKECSAVADFLGFQIDCTEQTNNVREVDENLDEYIGCDEVGVGDYFGGLVTCAAYVNRASQKKIKEIGVCDSKKINDYQIYKIWEMIKNKIEFCVAIYSPKEYNEIIKKWDNTHIAKALLHNQAIKNLKKKIKKNCPVIMDQFVSKQKYQEYFKKINIEPENIDRFETKAESKYIGVAVASIIARVHFLEQISDLEKKANCRIPLGASNSKIIECARGITKEKLESFVKIDFTTTKKL